MKPIWVLKVITFQILQKMVIIELRILIPKSNYSI